MENNTKTQIEKLVAEMAEKHDYLQALGSTSNAARDLADDCLKRKCVSQLATYRVLPTTFLRNLARLELNLLFLHQTYLHGCEEEFEKEMREIVKRVAFKEKINVED